MIVVGYGRFGQTAAQMLMAKRIPVTLIDNEAAEDRDCRNDSASKVYYGDGMRLDLLRAAGAETAKAILFCNDNRDGDLNRAAVSRCWRPFPKRPFWFEHSIGST